MLYAPDSEKEQSFVRLTLKNLSLKNLNAFTEDECPPRGIVLPEPSRRTTSYDAFDATYAFAPADWVDIKPKVLALIAAFGFLHELQEPVAPAPQPQVDAKIGRRTGWRQACQQDAQGLRQGGRSRCDETGAKRQNKAEQDSRPSARAGASRSGSGR